MTASPREGVSLWLFAMRMVRSSTHARSQPAGHRPPPVSSPAGHPWRRQGRPNVRLRTWVSFTRSGKQLVRVPGACQPALP